MARALLETDVSETNKSESRTPEAPGGPDTGPNVQSGAQQDGNFQGNY